MAAPLSLKEQRQKEAKEYQGLSKKAIQEGLGKMIAPEVCRLEELYQLSRNEELDPNASEGVLKNLAEERISLLKTRVQEGKAPFETTFFSNQWLWDQIEEHYLWQGKLRPLEIQQRQFIWKPKWVDEPSPYGPEGTPPSRL